MDTDVAGKRVAILVHNYFEQDEFEEPLTALKDAGVIVTVVSASGGLQLAGMHHTDVSGKFQADVLLEEAARDDYDGLVLPGGVVNADALRAVPMAQEWAVDFLDSGKPVAAICHAPWLLVSADAVEGRRLTSYHTLQDDIQNAGGEWVDQAVVVDDNLVTSREPNDLPAFCDAFIKLLAATTAVDLALEDPRANASPPLDERAVDDDGRLNPLDYDKQRGLLTFRDEYHIL